MGKGKSVVKNTEITKKAKDTKSTDDKQRYKIKRNLVITVLVIAIIIIYIIQRGEFLEIREIGENYIPVFWKNFKAISISYILNFAIIFSAVYFSTKKIKNGLKTFFEDEKKTMPKLPQKSVSFIIAILVSIFTSNIIMQRALLCFNNMRFVITDPALGHDIGFYVFILPFIKLVVMYLLILLIGITVYSAIYYLLVFNICFDGINRESVKKSSLLNQIISTVKLIAINFAAVVLVETQNIGVQKFITLNSDESLNYSLYGAGSVEIYIRYFAYLLLAFLIVFSVFRVIREVKKKNTRKIIRNILIVPFYLVLVAIVMLGYNLIFINANELDREKQYISDNIKYTQRAYGIDIDTVQISDKGPISEGDVVDNAETLNNIPIVSQDMVLKDLNTTSLSSDEHYKYTYSSNAVYAIDDSNQLIYIIPREISNNDSEYANKTYEYTHGYGLVVASANKTNTNGTVKYVQESFDEADNILNITQPRIYFGRETNSTVVTNSTSKKEFDYPLSKTENAENYYDGKAGLKLNLLDKIIIAIKEKDAKLAFSGGVKEDSKILTNRNIINRAKTIMPYLMYDENPYIVVRNNGELVWVLDAYTTTNNYPYSQRLILEDYGISKNEINYIRNSVKVIINAYTGEINFYLTDSDDPIVSAYKKIYPDLFSKEEIPEDISSHFTYPSYLYKIQSEIIARYHDIEADDLYRSDDVWEIATQNTTQISTKTGTVIEPYYTVLKTVDSNSARLGLVVPYTPYGKGNITAYLVGSVDENGKNILKTYRYEKGSNVVGPIQLDAQIMQDEAISAEIEALNTAGTKIMKNIVLVPIKDKLVSVESIYQQYVNDENAVPVLRKVIIASGSKVTTGNSYEEALNNLISQNALEIEVDNTDDIDDLVEAIIRANNNLKISTQSGDWAQMGKDTSKLQELISRIEELKQKEEEKKSEESTVDELAE